MNTVEQFFRDITTERLRRGVFTSVPELIAVIDAYIAHHNAKPKPFIRTKSARDILQKVIRANSRLGSKQNETLRYIRSALRAGFAARRSAAGDIVGRPQGPTMSSPTISAAPASTAKGRVVLAAIVGGLIAGTVDIGAAALIGRMDPRVILRFIAGGLQGRAALAGGAASAWLGFLLQWGMSILIAAIFVFATLRLRWMTTRWVSAGLAYGVAVFVAMNDVVLPLSAWHHANHFSLTSFFENLAAMLLFGLIIAFAARKLAGDPARG